jgi:acyl carrier protein
VDLAAELEAFVVEELAVGRGLRSVGPDDDLLAAGIVDSLGVTQLVTYLEDRFGIRVTDEELTPANFRSVAAIESFIGCKQPC